jgi:hypothetical protein
MKCLPRNTLYLLLIAGLLLTGCELFSGTATPNNNSDTGYTWAREKALEAVNSEYQGDFFVHSFRSQRVDISGQLDKAMQAPYWEFIILDGVEVLLDVRVSALGKVSIFPWFRYHDYDPLAGTYPDHDLRNWLGNARTAYRDISGRDDDVSYGLECRGYGNGDYAYIDLYNKYGTMVGSVSLNPETGEIYRLRIR